MTRPKSSRDWVHRHLNDPYVKRAQEDGYRSRAAYKLLEFNRREPLLKPGMTVIDLGSTPGGWSQVAAQTVGVKGKVIAIDLLEMKPVTGVHFIHDDFSHDTGLHAVISALGENNKADLVISDMSPNLTGNRVIDQARLYALCELAADFAVHFLKPNGIFLVKVFQGEGFEPYLKLLRQNFLKVSTKKPDASRDESRETYIIAKGIKQEAVALNCNS